MAHIVTTNILMKVDIFSYVFLKLQKEMVFYRDDGKWISKFSSHT